MKRTNSVLCGMTLLISLLTSLLGAGTAISASSSCSDDEMFNMVARNMTEEQIREKCGIGERHKGQGSLTPQEQEAAQKAAAQKKQAESKTAIEHGLNPQAEEPRRQAQEYRQPPRGKESGKWNDTDSRMVSREVIADALSFPWADQFSKQNGRSPVVVAVGVKNRSAEPINMQTFMKDLERAFLQSGRVNVVADRDQRADLRVERADPRGGFTANPAKVGKDVGADFVLTGSINSIQDRSGNQEVVFYQTSLELVNVETNQKVWIGENKIKKQIVRAVTR